ncbi:MAG TPA: hypothetical protein VF661_14540 [Actinomycetales bacterium]
MTAVLLHAASLVAVVLLGTSAGVHVCGAAALNPALRALDAPAYVAVKQSADRCFPVLMKPLTLAGLAALLLQGVLAGLTGRADVAALAAVGLLAATAALVAVLRGDLPINERMAGWTSAQPPTDWQTWRNRWERYFLARTLATVTAFLAALAGLAVLP